MSLRISSAALAFAVLAACSAQSPVAEGETVDCAIGGAADFGADCTLERVSGAEEIVIHHPDGGFRRFRIDPATGAVAALDGAEPLVIAQADAGTVQFAVGPDRYRLAANLAPIPALTPAPQ